MTADRDQETLFEDNTEYAAFTRKFEAKRTTDDCYTPKPVYDAVAEWVEREYRLDRLNFTRPFWPDTDFTTFPYPPGCIVVDNPPFSLFAAILDFYTARGIRFFLFGPALTLFSRRNLPGICYFPTGSDVRYENGATVKTSFVTNLDRYKIRTAPDLAAAVQAADKKARGRIGKPTYEYPKHLVTAAIMQKIAGQGVDVRIMPEECAAVSNIEAMRKAGKAPFGGAFLLSDGAARRWAEAQDAAKAAKAAKAADCLDDDGTFTWKLSEKELSIIRGLA